MPDVDIPAPLPAAVEPPRRGASIASILIDESEPVDTINDDPTLQTLGSHHPRAASATGADLPAASWQSFQPTSLPRDSNTPRPSTAPAPTYASNFSSPACIVELQKRHEDGPSTTIPAGASFLTGNTASASPASLPTPGALAQPRLSRREAYLIQHFINKIGPWMDVCDAHMHFTHELPRQAMSKPMVLYALLALTSRHLAILARLTEEPAEAAFYHGQCLKYVINQLQGPEALYDDSLFATVVCLRMYEEIDFTNDAAYHLAGTDRLMRAIPTFAISGGLAEAACWQSLRQDIYLSMARSIPPSFDLENFELSSVFTFRDDGACANVIILIFAKLLRLAYTEGEQNNVSAWDRLALDVEAWNDRRLRLFQPIYYEDLDLADNRPFPIVHCITPPQGECFDGAQGVCILTFFSRCVTIFPLLSHLSPSIQASDRTGKISIPCLEAETSTGGMYKALASHVHSC